MLLKTLATKVYYCCYMPFYKKHIIISLFIAILHKSSPILLINEWYSARDRSSVLPTLLKCSHNFMQLKNLQKKKQNKFYLNKRNSKTFTNSTDRSKVIKKTQTDNIVSWLNYDYESLIAIAAISRLWEIWMPLQQHPCHASANQSWDINLCYLTSIVC